MSTATIVFNGFCHRRLKQNIQLLTCRVGRDLLCNNRQVPTSQKLQQHPLRLVSTSPWRCQQRPPQPPITTPIRKRTKVSSSKQSPFTSSGGAGTKGVTNRLSSSSSSASSTSSSSSTTSQLLDNNLPFMNVKRLPTFMNLSYSELSGNASFVLAVTAYLNTDILVLRYLAMGSITLSTIFQYYRKQPSWIPIRWNILLLIVNAAMTTALLIERYRATHMMPSEWEYLYTNANFEQRGFNRVEFYKFMSLGTKTELRKGHVLAQDGQPNTVLYFLTDGKISIKKNGVEIATVLPYHFIGEMAFLNHMMAYESPKADDAESAAKPAKVAVSLLDTNQASTTIKAGEKNSKQNVATADAVVGGGSGDRPAVVYVWDYNELKQSLLHERSISNALVAYLSHDLRVKLVNAGVSMLELDNKVYNTVSQCTTTPTATTAANATNTGAAVGSTGSKSQRPQ